MLPQLEDYVLAREGVADIVEFEEHFRQQGGGDANQSRAIMWQLCVETLLPMPSAWRTSLNFSICFNQCNTTWCPQPASDFLTPAKAEACLPDSVQWSDVQSCVSASGAALEAADAAQSEKECPGCPGPTVHINGNYAGHFPDQTTHTLLRQICGNYTSGGGTPPPGCTIDDEDQDATRREFTEWASTHKKAYLAREGLDADDAESTSEFALRYAAFRASVKRIAALNVAHAPHTTFALNQFSDLSPAEFTARMHTHREGSVVERATFAARTPIASTSSSPRAAPEAWDWATKKALTPIKNQGQCGCVRSLL